jgi:hypothetical protein
MRRIRTTDEVLVMAERLRFCLGRALPGLLLWAGACGGDGGGEDTPSGRSDNTSLFAVSTQIFDDMNTTSYVSFIPSLDSQQVSIANAATFPGYSSIAASEGAFFVGGGEAPEVTRYNVSGSGQLDSGQKLSFGNFGLKSVTFSHNAFVDDATAHLRLEETSRIVWDQKALTIAGVVDAPQIARERDGLQVSAANFEGIALRKDGVLWPYFWHDEDWYKFHQQSQIAVYAKDGSVKKLIDTPCPALNIATADEKGNVYFSGMVDTLAAQSLEPNDTLQRCVVRINAGEEKIADGWPKRFEELTEGRPAGRFYYLKDGVGLLTVFHKERATVDPTDTFGSFFADHWGLWLVDLEAWKAKPIEQWGFGSSNMFFSRVDGRTFLHTVKKDFSETTIHEVKVDGSVTPQITVPGYSTVLVKVR